MLPVSFFPRIVYNAKSIKTTRGIMLNLRKPPKRAKSIERLREADEYFAKLWLLGANYVNKTVVNKKFGRNQTNQALARYFVLEHRGSNVSKKLTELRARDIDDLPEDRQTYLLTTAVKSNVQVELNEVIEDPPENFDEKSVICVAKEKLDEAVRWCIDNRKFQFIKPVRILLSRQIWTVYYKEKSDRFFAIWPFCLTNWPGALRKIILQGVDFDITNSIGQFILEKVGEKIDKFPVAKDYLNDSKKTRALLIAKLKIDGVQAKKVLHATTNGCSISQSSILNGKSALLDIVSQAQALEYVTLFSDLVNQLKKTRKIISPNNKEFMRQYFEWEKQKTGTFFNGTGLIMHDGIDGCSLSTIIPPEFSNEIKMSESRSVWDESSVVDRLITM